jgi:hypothetical protein
MDPDRTAGRRNEGISCYSASLCIAVGSKEGASRYWKLEYGLTKSSGALAVPSGGASLELRSVSCTSSSAGTAVGAYYYEGKEWKSLVERWDGTTWSLATPANPTGATSATLESVSCNSASACTAVGNFKEATGNRKPLAETWNGSSWSVKSVPNPGDAVGNVKLRAVSCLSASSCFAVGNYVSAEFSSQEKSLAETWNGTN